MPVPHQGGHSEGRIQKQGEARHAGQTRAEDSNCTMLLVDRGFPIDVIFYASVWERRETKRREQEGKQQTGMISAWWRSQGHPVAQAQNHQKAAGTQEGSGANVPHLQQAPPLQMLPDPKGTGREVVRVGSESRDTQGTTGSAPLLWGERGQNLPRHGGLGERLTSVSVWGTQAQGFLGC